MSPIANGNQPSFLRRIPPAVWFFAFLLGGWGLDRLVPLPIPFPSFAWQLWPALVLFAAAALSAYSAIRLFAAKRTSLLPFSEASTLLDSGPFRVSRNPLYVALVATLVAFGLLLASVWLLLAAALLAVALDRFVIRAEESALSKAFGEQYAEYARRVSRWL
ncbi:isoprenylcysteine carboxylmethyltransferase family protein [bacterium]|nr:isoprenylcysteine carboxylmethyltransferase family protein [bacterium]